MTERNFTDVDAQYEEIFEPANRSLDEDYVEDSPELSEDFDIDSDEDISDDYDFEYDGPSEAEEWRDYDPDC